MRMLVIAKRCVPAMKPHNLLKRKFGYLTVVDRGGYTRDSKLHKKARLWVCRCTCGQIKVVRADHLRGGKIKACNIDGHRWRPRNDDRVVAGGTV